MKYHMEDIITKEASEKFADEIIKESRERNPIPILYDPKIVEAMRNEYEYIYPEHTTWGKILIWLGFRKRLKPIKIERRSLMETIPTIKFMKNYKGKFK